MKKIVLIPLILTIVVVGSLIFLLHVQIWNPSWNPFVSPDKDLSEFIVSPDEDLLEFKLVYEGNFSSDITYFQPWRRRNYFQSCRSANLFGDKQDYLIVDINIIKNIIEKRSASSYFEIFQFTDNEWKSFYKIPLADTDLNITTWTTGDLDKDGKDEIIIFVNETIKRYEWDGEQFKMTIYEFPYLVDDVLVGDIDNDNLNELVLFYYEDPKCDRNEPPECRYHLGVAKYDYDNEKISLFWTDNGKFGYLHSHVIPPDNLICIADVGNVGHNQLLVAEAQSDVSPTRYNLLSWEEKELKLLKSFRILNRTIITERQVEEWEGRASFLIGKLIPIEVKGKRMFLAGEESSGKTTTVLIETEDNELRVIKRIFDHSGWARPNKVFWMDIDGKGKGVLQLIMDKDEIKYMFYRY